MSEASDEKNKESDDTMKRLGWESVIETLSTFQARAPEPDPFDEEQAYRDWVKAKTSE